MPERPGEVEVEEAGGGIKARKVRQKRMIPKQSKVGTTPNYCLRAAAVEFRLLFDAL